MQKVTLDQALPWMDKIGLKEVIKAKGNGWLDFVEQLARGARNELN